MQHKNGILAIAILMGVFSCTHREDDGIQKVKFQAIQADGPSTKTVLQADGSVFWSPGDAVSLFYGGATIQKAKLTAENTSAAAQTTFSGVLDGFLPDGSTSFWAVYPYSAETAFDGSTVTVTVPAEQTAVAGTFASDAFVSIATSKDYTLQFYNLCGGIKFSVANQGITSVTFRGNDDEMLAGQVHAAFDENGRPVVTEVVKGAMELVLNAPEGGFEVGKWYYMVALPTSLSAGYTMTFLDAAGEVVAERVTDSSIAIKRAVWGKLTEPDDVFSASKFLTFTSDGTSTISMKNTGGNAPVLYYSTDQEHWTKWDYGELSFSANAPLYLCGINPDGFSSSTAVCSYFASSGDLYHVSGDVMSLIDKDEDVLSVPGDYCFVYLFYHCANLASAPELPALAVSKNGYRSMFNGCTALTDAPVLPATELADSCYFSMFSNCTGLLRAPEELPAAVVPKYAYRGMFNKCISMETGPALPATTLDERCYEAMFYACSGLTSAPELPATALSFACYHFMFWGCTSLTEAPELPATTLTEDCYNCMFYGCSSLLAAPALPATELAPYCYFAMFSGGCSSLAQAPEVLPATTVYESSYENMFWSCTSLTTPPALPATTLAKDCYRYMFWGCINLAAAPELPATTLVEGCYYNMFGSCETLESAPELPAAALADSCYYAMFESSPNLQYVKCLATDISANGCVDYWLNGVSDQGTFVKATLMNDWSQGIHGIPEGWTVENEDGTEVISASKYLTFTSEGETTISLSNYQNSPVLYFSYDAFNWTQWDYSDLTFTSEKPLYLCGDNPEGFSKGTSNYSNFKSSNSKYSISGDIMSLLDRENDLSTVPEYCFCNLFSNDEYLTVAPDLPAPILSEGCYESMFSSCSNLVTAPEISATKMAYRCCSSMFSHCSSLVTAPVLPAEELAEECYNLMFYACSSLAVVPDLPATTLATSCYSEMFSQCINLVNPPKLPATSLADGCYYSMFNYCINLESAPELPATVLAERCYCSMFDSCSKLTTAPVLPATTLAVNCYNHMFDECSNLIDVPELPATTLANYCYDGMFSRCSKIITAPVLPSTELATFCYASMFWECTSLAVAPELPATKLADDCYNSMFSGCTSLTEAPALPATELVPGCYEFMFSGCTSLTSAPDLLASSPASWYCYYYMFSGCTNLSYIKCLLTSIGREENTRCWLQGVSPTGTFVKAASMNDWPTGDNGIPEGWTVQDAEAVDLDGRWEALRFNDDPTSTAFVALFESSNLDLYVIPYGQHYVGTYQYADGAIVYTISEAYQAYTDVTFDEEGHMTSHSWQAGNLDASTLTLSAGYDWYEMDAETLADYKVDLAEFSFQLQAGNTSATSALFGIDDLVFTKVN